MKILVKFLCFSGRGLPNRPEGFQIFLDEPDAPKKVAPHGCQYSFRLVSEVGPVLVISDQDPQQGFELPDEIHETITQDSGLPYNKGKVKDRPPMPPHLRVEPGFVKLIKPTEAGETIESICGYVSTKDKMFYPDGCGKAEEIKRSSYTIERTVQIAQGKAHAKNRLGTEPRFLKSLKMT